MTVSVEAPMNWMLMDMNSYFALCEQYLRPELRGKPVGIIPLETDFTSLIAASLEAKEFGAKTGTGVREARELCPRIRLVKARPAVYTSLHHRILKAVDDCAPVYRVYSIDEWSFRLQGQDQIPEQARQLGLAIKRRLHQEFGPWLKCSLGIAPTRLLAKIASNLQKRDGLTLLSVSDLPGRLESMSLDDLTGIGKGMMNRFQQHGIHTVPQLWAITQEEAVRIWGSVSGARWWAGFHGIDEPEPPTRRRSMSHGCVLAPEHRHAAGTHSMLARLLCRLAQRLRDQGYLAGNLKMALLDVTGRTHTDQIHIPLVNDTTILLEQMEVMWQRRPVPHRPYKKADLCAGLLRHKTLVPRSLFSESLRHERLSTALDEINKRLKSQTALFPGSVFSCRQTMDEKIAFGRIPTEGADLVLPDPVSPRLLPANQRVH